MGWGCVRFEVGAIARLGAVAALSLGLAHCSKVSNKYGVPPSARVIGPGEEVPKGNGVYRVGKPYVVAGQTYVPEDNPNYTGEGLASWYGEDFHGRQTANGEVYDMNSLSAAHPTLPIPSYVRVTNLRNKRSVIVRVNDRGPFHAGRVIDVSVRTARLLGFYDQGTTRVRVDYVGKASLAGSDDEKLAATLRHGDTPAAPAAPAPTMVASNSPQFLGQFFNPKPLTGNAVATPAETQVPAARPVATTPEVARRPLSAPPPAARPAAYELAASRNVPAPAPVARTATAEPPATFESRFGPAATVAPVRTEPVSAYAPNPVAPASVLTGRGLY